MIEATNMIWKRKNTKVPSGCAYSAKQLATRIHSGDVLQRYMDGDLDVEQTEFVQDCLDGCENCQSELAAYRSLRAALRDRFEPSRSTKVHLESLVGQLESAIGSSATA